MSDATLKALAPVVYELVNGDAVMNRIEVVEQVAADYARLVAKVRDPVILYDLHLALAGEGAEGRRREQKARARGNGVVVPFPSRRDPAKEH